MSIEAMKQALEALQWIKSGMGCNDIDATIQTLRTAIEAAENRKWVGLTEEEREDLNYPDEYTCYLYPEEWKEVGRPFAKAIEAKLKQKNGYAEEKNT